MGIESESTDYVIESSKSLESYAETFGFSPQEFDALIQGQDVLELEAGTVQFATEIELRKLNDSSYNGPKNVYSADARFADKNYAAQWYRTAGRALLAKHRADTSQVKKALENIQPHCVALEGNGLASLRAKGLTFGRILLKNPAALLEDMSTPAPDVEERFTMGPQSKNALMDISMLLSDGGVGLLQTDWEYWQWGMLPEAFVDTFYKFLNSIGLEGEVYPARQGEGALCALRVTKKAK